jgi:hypothetical protein
MSHFVALDGRKILKNEVWFITSAVDEVSTRVRGQVTCGWLAISSQF